MSQPKPKYAAIDRSQMRFVPLDYERLIPQDHAARGIWELLERLDFTAFDSEARSFEGQAGRPRIEPRLLASVWIYGYSIGVASARALDRMMPWEPGLRWLCADSEINYHTLSDFRVSQQERLDKLFASVLRALDGEGLVDLELVTQDGTKVRARAGKQSLHRRAKIEHELALAREYMREMDRRACEDEAQDERRVAAQTRAARERVDRMQAALCELDDRKQEGNCAEDRASTSETGAPKMKHNDGGYAPSRNVQLSVDSKSGVIVGVRVTTAPNDVGQLEPAVEQIEKNCGRKPKLMLADNGYATRHNVEAMSKRSIEFVAPWKDEKSRQAGVCATLGIATEFTPSAFAWDQQAGAFRCPAGNTLLPVGELTNHGQRHAIYSAARQDCASCAMAKGCCGKLGGPRRLRRVIESPAMAAYLERMSRPDKQALYKRRSVVAETPHMRIKENWGWRRFSVRGLANAAKEAIWVAIAYNIHVWTRLRWTARAAA